MADRVHRSEPISIPHHSQHRTRSASLSSDDDDNNSPPLQTPYQGPAPRVATAQSPSTSPILSYFFQSPSKVSGGLPPSPTTTSFGTLGRSVAARPPQEKPIMEEDEEPYGGETPLMRHARRVSTSATWASPPSRTPFNPVMPAGDASERGAGLLRRLSLGSALVRPQVSPPHKTAALAPAAPGEVRAVAPSSVSSPGRKKQRRASTFGVAGEGSARAPRSPSPMGERILKGHFDGFN